MFITTEATPNPRTRKFFPGLVVSAHPVDFSSGGSDDPFVASIFAIEHVHGLHLGYDFLSVSVDDPENWNDIAMKVKQTIEDGIGHFQGVAVDDFNLPNETDAEVVVRIKDLLNTHVRPAVARDGGDIVFKSFESGVLTLQMRGACSGCPSSAATLQMGIQRLVQHFVPEVEEIRSDEFDN